MNADSPTDFTNATPRDFLRRLVAAEELSAPAMKALMEQIMNGSWTPPQIAAFMVAMSAKGETSEELVSAACVMRDHSLGKPGKPQPVLDIVGSGGDGLQTPNISSVAALIAASCGAAVAKHGNRAVSSQCGSADVLEALGLRLDLPPAAALACLEATGFTFLFAQTFHPAMKHAAQARKEIGLPSIFNLLGPLTNPAHAQRFLLGVSKKANLHRFAHALKGLNTSHALIVHGADGMDEISLSGPTQVIELKQGNIREYQLTPQQLEVPAFPLAQLQVKSRPQAIAVAEQILNGKAATPFQELAAVNAGAGIYLAGLADSIKKGIAMAKHAVSAGKTHKLLQQLRSFHQQHAPSSTRS